MTDEDFAGTLDVPTPEIPFGEEEYRWRVHIARPAFAEYAIGQIWNMRISIALKRSWTHIIKAYISESAIFAHNRSVEDAMMSFMVSEIEAKGSFAPHDATVPELSVLIGAIKREYANIASRTVGGEKSRERTLQHRTVSEQHVSQTLEQKQPEKKKGIFGI